MLLITTPIPIASLVKTSLKIYLLKSFPRFVGNDRGLLVTLEDTISIKSNFAAFLSFPVRSFDPREVIGPAIASFVVDTASYMFAQFSEVKF